MAGGGTGIGWPYLARPISKVEIDEGRGTRYAFAAANCQGWRCTQEDAHLALPNFQPNTSLFGVFDGHNGPEVARFVASHFAAYLAKNQAYCGGQIERGIQEVFMLLDEALLKRDANDEMLRYRAEASGAAGASTSSSSSSASSSSSWASTPNSNHIGSPTSATPTTNPATAATIAAMPIALLTGCTGVVLLIKNDIYYCANVGDSRCIVARDGRPLPLSRDHKPDSAEERDRIERAGGVVVNGRINQCIDISRAFGDHHFKSNARLGAKSQIVTAWPHTAVEHANSRLDQFAVLMCDGVWNAMSNQEVCDYVRRALSRNVTLGKICDEIIRQILPVVMPARGIVGKDNMTIMIVKPIMGSKNHSPSPSPSASPSSGPIRSTISGGGGEKTLPKRSRSKTSEISKSKSSSSGNNAGKNHSSRTAAGSNKSNIHHRQSPSMSGGGGVGRRASNKISGTATVLERIKSKARSSTSNKSEANNKQQQQQQQHNHVDSNRRRSS